MESASEAIVELEAQFVLTTKTTVQDNKDGSYKISYFSKEAAKCEVSVKVNGEHIPGSPFAVQVKHFRPVLSFGHILDKVRLLECLAILKKWQ